VTNQVSQDAKRELAASGIARGQVWGGPQKTRYYTPWGEEIWSVPSMRDWVRKDANGRVVAQGARDANLDKGWTLSPPTEPKQHCAGCDAWHDTEEETAACVVAKSDAAEAWDKKARLMRAKESGVGTDDSTSDRLEQLEGGQARIEGLLTKLLERDG
jgi:hypothetical protein